MNFGNLFRRFSAMLARKAYPNSVLVQFIPFQNQIYWSILSSSLHTGLRVTGLTLGGTVQQQYGEPLTENEMSFISAMSTSDIKQNQA